MKWNWQQDGWPRFTCHGTVLAKAEAQLLHRSGMQIGAVKHLAAEEKTRLTIDLISNEAVTTSEIEGEVLNRDTQCGRPSAGISD